MRRLGVEEQRIARVHVVGSLAVAVHDVALEHVEEFEPRVLERREDIRLVGERDEIWLHHHRPMGAVAEQFILVAGTGAAPLDGEAFSRLHKSGVADFLVGLEEGGDRHLQRTAQRLQRGERG